jgi:hypothetical protein
LPPVESYHSYYKYYVFIRPERLADGWDRERIRAAIGAEGIPCFAGSCGEIYREQAFEPMRPAARLPVARQLTETSLMFLVHSTLSEADTDDTVAAVRKVMTAAAR